MGWDIRAWVEVHMDWMEALKDLGEDTWHPVVDASILVGGRDYDLWGCLFGAVNRANFIPIAAGRGLPDDASKAVKDEAARAAEMDPGAGFVWPTWVT